MDEYIKREALLEAIDEAFDKSPVEDTTAWMKGRRIVRTFPAADIEEVKHGEWLENGASYKCSECGKYDTYGLDPYCCNCGAKMDGGAGT